MSKRRTPSLESRARVVPKEQTGVKLTAEVSREHQLNKRKYGFGRYLIAAGVSRPTGRLRIGRTSSQRVRARYRIEARISP